MRTNFKTGVVASLTLLAFLFSNTAVAKTKAAVTEEQTTAVPVVSSNTSQAFGNATMTEMTPVKKKDGECMSFEASFSEPLQSNPSAVLDVEHHFVNLLNATLEVTKISDKKYRMALTAKKTDGCPSVPEDSSLTISTYSNKDETNSQQALPQAVTFKAEKNSLKKE